MTIVAVLIGCAFTMPASWCSPDTPPAGDPPIPHRIVLATLNDGTGLVRVQTASGVAYRRLPDQSVGM